MFEKGAEPPTALIVLRRGLSPSESPLNERLLVEHFDFLLCSSSQACSQACISGSGVEEGV